MAKRRIGPFDLEKRLGVGGMGIVYLAVHRKTGRKMALKVLSPELSSNSQLLKRFEREMKILERLRHDHIVRYYGGGSDGSQHYFAMELMEGGSLERVLKKKGKLSWEQTIECGRQIAQALEFAHRYGIIHRDLKPANLFLSRRGQLKLGDFGIARDTEATALTRAGRTVGTFAYMAPEQISGKHPISGKTDLYALGCVMFEMLTGRPPFHGDTQAEMLFQHLQQEPPRVTEIAIDCPVWLESVIDKLLEKDPAERFYDALALQVALDEVKEKIAQQTSVAKQTVAGDGTKTVTEDRTELNRILGRKKKRKKKKKFVPVYERMWFLTTCLVVLTAGVIWSLIPLSDEELYARARPLMESNDPDQWRVAREDYLNELLEKHPDSPHRPKALEWIDQIEMDIAMRRAVTSAKLGREPRSEAERLFIEAWRFENFGDRVTAHERYRSFAEVFEASEDKNDRAYVNLARRQMSQIVESGQLDDRTEIVNESLRRADAHYAKGETFKARSIWESIVTLYGSNLEFQRQVKYCRARLTGQQTEPFDFGEPGKQSDEVASDGGQAVNNSTDSGKDGPDKDAIESTHR